MNTRPRGAGIFVRLRSGYRKSAGARREDNGTALAGIAGQARTEGERIASDVTRREVAAGDTGILIGWSWSADCVCKATRTADAYGENL